MLSLCVTVDHLLEERLHVVRARLRVVLQVVFRVVTLNLRFEELEELGEDIANLVRDLLEVGEPGEDGRLPVGDTV